MAASDHLGPQWYHASPHDFAEGDLVEPGHVPSYSAERQQHVYATTSKRNAMTWARTSPSPSSVYRVSAPSAYEDDPLPTGPQEYRTKESLRVLGMVKRYPGQDS